MYAVKTGKSLHLRRINRTAKRAALPAKLAAHISSAILDRVIPPLLFYSRCAQRPRAERAAATAMLVDEAVPCPGGGFPPPGVAKTGSAPNDNKTAAVRARRRDFLMVGSPDLRRGATSA
jgi:hypothetical protein